MNYRFHPEAESELNDSVAYYESQKDGLGMEFLKELESTIQRVLNHPSAWPKISDRCRRCIVNRFPFGIIYSLLEDYILIIAIMPLSRKPGYWESRLAFK